MGRPCQGGYRTGADGLGCVRSTWLQSSLYRGRGWCWGSQILAGEGEAWWHTAIRAPPGPETWGSEHEEPWAQAGKLISQRVRGSQLTGTADLGDRGCPSADWRGLRPLSPCRSQGGLSLPVTFSPPKGFAARAKGREG